MKINKSFTKIILGLLLACLLTFGVSGRLVSVYALADPVIQDIAPVYETQIYQLQDYISQDLEAPQLEVFYLLWAFYQFAMAGAEDYTIPNPYETQDGVINWLKGIGVDAYNTLIALSPDFVNLPDGSIMSTDSLKRALRADIEAAMGLALKASTYDDTQDLLDDISNSDHYFIPWNANMQYGLNTMYQTYGGMFNWQFQTRPFTSGVSYNQGTIPSTSAYWTAYNNLSEPKVRFNYSDPNVAYAIVGAGDYFTNYRNLFLNTSTGKVLICNEHGNTSYYARYHVIQMQPNLYESNVSYVTKTPNYPTYSTFVESVREIYRRSASTSGYFLDNSTYMFLEDFIEHVYVGDSWANRSEIFNVEGHNLETQNQPYYVSVPDDGDYWLDIKGILTDILNNTDLFDVFINNIYTPDGVLVHDTDLIRISLELLQEYLEQNPPIPVNLNDLVEVTDNDYIDKLKEHAEDASNVLGLLVSAAHNIDYEFLYIILGTSLFTLICALLGKMGK